MMTEAAGGSAHHRPPTADHAKPPPICTASGASTPASIPARQTRKSVTGIIHDVAMTLVTAAAAIARTDGPPGFTTAPTRYTASTQAFESAESARHQSAFAHQACPSGAGLESGTWPRSRAS